MGVPPSGEQHEITFGDQRATIVEVGGGVREYRAGDRDVLESYPVDAMCDGAHGAVLAPWPNRLADGRYSFDGADFQVPLTEPEKGNAIHGFLRWTPMQAIEKSEARVVMRTVIHPSKGYPFTLEISVAYELGEGGLTVATTAANLGDVACPYGLGQHPYLSPGSGLIDECTLEFTAGTRITTDDVRQLPTGREPVAGTDFDFSASRPLGALAIDFAFTDLARDDEGLAWVRLAAPDSRTAELWVDQHYPFIELYSGDMLAEPRRRRGLGAEPMTCPPNALASGEDVIHLGPGESITTTWGARLT